MRKVFLAAVIALMVIAVKEAQAVPLLNVHICQGLTCVDFGPAPGPGPFVNNNVVVGDFRISGSVSTLENPLLSNAATTTISVQRVSELNPVDTLDIWLSAQNYNLPVITNGYTLAQTSSFTGSAAPTDVQTSFQSWLTLGNVLAFPPAGSTTPGITDCTLSAGTDACSAQTLSIIGASGSNPFTLTTRTSFTIDTASAIASYTSNAQANVSPAEIPEPISLFLVGSGLIAGVARLKRGKKRPVIIA